MAVGLKFAGFVGVSIIALTVNSFAQQVEAVSEQVEPIPEEEEIYVPRQPTQEELAHYALIDETRQKWNVLFDDPKNAELHWEIARTYIKLGNGDIALHELERTEALGVEREKLLADLGKAYLLRGRYDDIFAEILLEDAPLNDHGEIYLIYGQAHFAQNNKEQAFINFYQAMEFIGEDRLDLNKPLAALFSLMGEYEKAELNVDKALGFDAKDADLLVLKGELVHRREGAEGSYRYFELADFYRPDDILVETKLAGALYNLKRRDEAMDVLRKILAKQQNHPYANFMIAALFAEGNNVRTATRYMNQAGDAYDDFVPGLLLRAKLAYVSGSYQQAETSLARALRIEPDNGEARRLLGASLMQLGKHADAVRVLSYLIDSNSLVGSDFFLLGSAYALAGNNDKATEYLKLASNDDLLRVSEEERRYLAKFVRGDNFGVSLNVARILNSNANSNQRLIIQTYAALAKGKYKDAVDLAAAIIDQNRGSPIGFNLLGLTYLGQNKIDEARSNFRRAIEIDSDFHQARVNLAKLESYFGNQNAAMTNLNEILSRDESYIPAYELLFENSLYDGDLIRAERYLVTATNANPGLVSVRERLLKFYFDENEISKAKSFAMRMVRDFPDHPAGYKALGRVNISQNDFADAVGNLEKSSELFNGDEETYLMLANAYVSNEQLAQARNMLKNGLIHVKEILPLQRELIELAKVDGDFVSGHHYADQLKLSERTKAEGYMWQGDLNILENRAEDAISAYLSAAKAGANQEAVQIGLDKARSLAPAPTPAPVETPEPVS